MNFDLAKPVLIHDIDIVAFPRLVDMVHLELSLADQYRQLKV